jgi:hypothetical protein
MTPERIQLSRAKGWRMPPNTVKVDRTTKWGNPFRDYGPPVKHLLEVWGWKLRNWGEECGTAEEAVQRFRACVAFDGASIALARKELRGNNLACWCPPGAPCHADVLLEIANG